MDLAHAALAPSFLAGVSTAGDFSACPGDGHLDSFGRRWLSLVFWGLGVRFARALVGGPSHRSLAVEPMELDASAANALVANGNGHGGRFAQREFHRSLAAS